MTIPAPTNRERAERLAEALRIHPVHWGERVFNAEGVALIQSALDAAHALGVAEERERVDELREAVTLIANSMGDVVTLGRFAKSVDPIRLVSDWHTHLCYAIHKALAAPSSGVPAKEGK